MRDDDGRTVRHQFFQGFPHRMLVDRIEMRCRLIQDQHWCVLRKARAMATRWRWPPESRIPRSPTFVSRPSGRPATNSPSEARSIAAISATSSASGLAIRMLARSVSLKR